MSLPRGEDGPYGNSLTLDRWAHPGEPLAWSLIWTHIDPVSYVSCVSWMYSVNAVETHETVHSESDMRYQPSPIELATWWSTGWQRGTHALLGGWIPHDLDGLADWFGHDRRFVVRHAARHGRGHRGVEDAQPPPCGTVRNIATHAVYAIKLYVSAVALSILWAYDGAA